MSKYKKQPPDWFDGTYSEYIHTFPSQAKEQKARRSRARRYGVGVEVIDELLSRARCDACGGTEHYGRGWAVDHNHLTGKIRGLLCNPCNRALGMAFEDARRLRLLADYIDREGVR